MDDPFVCQVVKVYSKDCTGILFQNNYNDYYFGSRCQKGLDNN